MTGARARSISQRLTSMNMLVVSGMHMRLTANQAGVTFYRSLRPPRPFRGTMLRDLSTEAQIVASNSASSLLFQRPGVGGTDALSALKASPDILLAQIYTPDGRLFASYARAGAALSDARRHAPSIPNWPAPRSRSIFDIRSVDLARRMVFDGTPTGVVRIRSDLQAMYNRAERYALIVAVVLFISLVAAWGVSYLAQRAIAAPLAEVANVARRVSEEKDFSARAPRVESTYELSVLVDSFNTMLAEIQSRDRSLQEAQTQLEARVRQRTEELNASNSELEAFSVIRCSHDLRAPLAAFIITGFSSLLEQHAGPSLDDQSRRDMKTITDAAGRMSTLIDDLLAFSKMGRASLTKARI